MRTTLFAATLLLFVTAAHAQEPIAPPFAWSLLGTFPVDGESAAPLNGVSAVQLQYGLDSQWPSEDDILRSVDLRLTRGEDEDVPGIVAIAPRLEEVRFITDFPLDEGVEYTLHIDLLNSALAPDTEDITHTIVFTTGNRFDEAPPAFSGLQRLAVTELEDPVTSCCPATEAYCESQQEPDCTWCWIADFGYLPAVELTFRSVDDEFGPKPVAYLVYQLASENEEPDIPLTVVRFDDAGDQLLRLVPHTPAPWCYYIQSVDIWGQTDANQSILCATEEDLVPIERSEVPPEDRSMCAEQEVEPDAGVPDAGVPDMGMSPDIGPDQPESPDAVAPGDDGCTCHSAGVTRGPWRWLSRR